MKAITDQRVKSDPNRKKKRVKWKRHYIKQIACTVLIFNMYIRVLAYLSNFNLKKLYTACFRPPVNF